MDQEGTTTEQASTENRAAWDRIAEGYDRHVTGTHLDLAERVLQRVGIDGGSRFLDVAAGSGALSLPAARRGAAVTATDLSPIMIEKLRRRARDAGLDLEAIVMDGHALRFGDATFDAVGSQFGVMLFPDLPRALAEMTRVTQPDGKVFLVVFGEPSQVEFLAFFIQALKHVRPGFAGLPRDPPPLPFQVSRPETLRARMEEAGLRDVRVEPLTENLHFRSGDEMWAWLLSSNPLAGMLLQGVSEEERRAARERLDVMLKERAGEDGAATLTQPILLGHGTK